MKLAVSYIDAASGNKHDLPAIYTRSGILISHLRYLAWYSDKSSSWKEKSIFAVRLLIDYIEAASSIKKTVVLLKKFSEVLVTGTINYETNNDPFKLFWKPRDLTDANTILFHITHYTDFLARQERYDQERINPFIKATSHEERMNWCAYYHKQANVFLNHLSSYSEAKKLMAQKRLVSIPDQIFIKNEKAERFPETKIESLIKEGFSSKGTPDYRSQAITMLMNYGGLRKSEVFHIYTSDITINPNHKEEALVRVYDPIHGRSPDPKFKTRLEYLQSETNYKPRNTYRLTERLYSGWKSPLLTSTDGYFEVIFNPTHKAKEFLITWIKYLKHQRIEPDNFHPFAFTNNKGNPETIKNFQRRHKMAIERIGLKSAKELGTTEHGHRHAYGYRARKLGLNQIELQKAMHHKNPNSCLIYIKPTSEDIRNAMRKLEK